MVDEKIPAVGHGRWHGKSGVVSASGRLQEHLSFDAASRRCAALQNAFFQARRFFNTIISTTTWKVFFDDQSLFDRESKRPQNLLRDLYDPNIKWIIFIIRRSPRRKKAGYSGESKKSVSDTKIRPLMHQHGLGEVSRELFAQFLFRIRQEFAGKQAHLGLFSTLKYVNSNNDQKFRDQVFQFAFKDGFVFSSANFSGTQSANPFPVGFFVWDLAKHKKLEEQKLEVTVLDDDTSKLGRKLIASEHRDRFFEQVDCPS